MPFNQTIRLGDHSTSLVLAVRNSRLEFLHFGPPIDAPSGSDDVLFDPPVAPSSFDGPVAQHLIPSPLEGWTGSPGLQLVRAGGALVPDLTVEDITQSRHEITVHQADEHSQVRVTSVITFHPSGIFSITHELQNLAGATINVQRLATVVPVSGPMEEIYETVGRWTRETHPQTHQMPIGRWSRSTRQGRSGHNAPVYFAVGTRGATFQAGELWSIHLAHSSDGEHFLEKLPVGAQVIGAEVLLGPGEIQLQPDESFSTPPVLIAYTRAGHDGLAIRFHNFLRATSGNRDRRVTLNSWEAVYFNHSQDRLMAIADIAARVGIERFVLDDGWFLGRRDDTSSLGDWIVDPDVWPAGLGPLIRHVRSLGMDFGLWVEPEMISPRSRLAADHPDWISRVGPMVPRLWRNQQMLDLTNPEAWDHVHNSISTLLNAHDIAYLKWDMNRDSTTVGDGAHWRTHAQTIAVYRLIDQLRDEHPHLEIENCASGGGRIDLGLMSRTDRLWVSDSNDPQERQVVQQWAMQLIPPELIGSHVGAPTSHTTGRTQSIEFRVASAILADFGVEWNLAEAHDDELALLSEGIELHKRLRPLISSGRIVRTENHEQGTSVFGIIAPDRRHAVFRFTSLRTGPHSSPQPQRLPGLSSDLRYHLSIPFPAKPRVLEDQSIKWSKGVNAPGRMLVERGVPMPLLLPAESLLLEVRALAGE